jgi:hypothetical protein
VTALLLRLGIVGPGILTIPNWVLSPTEIATIQQRIVDMNDVIQTEASSRGFAVADVYSAFEYLAANPPVIGGVTLSQRYLGGVFSLDGVHPSNIGQAIMANIFLERFNAHYGTSFPLFSPAELGVIAALDPFVDRNGNGMVAGRPLAGLLETLGPVLGVSGDDESAGSGATASNRAGRAAAFLAEYRRLTARPAMADERTEAIQALHHVFGLDRLRARRPAALQ